MMNEVTNEATKGFSFSVGLPFTAEGTGSAAGDVAVTVIGNVLIGGAVVALANGLCWCGKQIGTAAGKAFNEVKAKAEAAPKAEEPEVINADGTAAQ